MWGLDVLLLREKLLSFEFPPDGESVCQAGVYSEIVFQSSTCFSVIFFSFAQFLVVAQPACAVF